MPLNHIRSKQGMKNWAQKVGFFYCLPPCRGSRQQSNVASPPPASGDHFALLLHFVAFAETKTNKGKLDSNDNIGRQYVWETFLPCFILQQEIYQAKLWLSLIVLFHTKINYWKKVVILISFELPYFCFDTPLRFWPLLKGKDINLKNLNVRTTPFSPSKRGHQDCNDRIGHRS